MNYRYIIKTLNARKIIEILMLDRGVSDAIPLISSRQSKSLTLKLSTIEENALFYQVSRTLYEFEGRIDDFVLDRNRYKLNHMPTVTKVNESLRDVIVYLDFSGVFTIKNHVKKNNYHEYARRLFDYGLIIETNSDSKIHFLPYLKSGSMGRRSTISFIRSDLKSALDSKLNFDLIHEDQKYSISKLQAYQGLYLSSGIRIELPEINSNNVIVVKDFNKVSVTDSFTTALSRSLIKEMVYDMFFTSDENYRENMNFFHWSIVNNSNHKKLYDSLEFTEICGDLHEAIQSELSFYSSLPSDKLSILDNIILDEYNLLINQIYSLLDMNNLEDDDELIVLEDVNIMNKTNMFDGEGFIDKSFLEQINITSLSRTEPPFHYSIQFRLPFTKGVLHAVDLPKWFKEGGIDYIVDAFGNLRATNGIKIILTQSQFKCYEWITTRYKNEEKPMDKYFEHFHAFNHALYITNLDQFEDKLFETILNYQVLHTPALTQKDFFELLTKSSVNYMDLVTDAQKQIDYFIRSRDYYEIDNEFQVNNDEQEMLIKILIKNSDFIYDDIYQNRINSYSKSLLKNMKTGRIQIEGSVRILSGDLLELLNQISHGSLYREGYTELLDNFYAPSKFNHFDKPKYYSILRNPHITSKELVVARPIQKNHNLQREEYFSHLTGVIMLNAYTNQMLAMQTADTDGDIVRIIANDVYNAAVIRSQSLNQRKLLYFPSLKGEKNYPTKENLFDSTKKSFSTRIGLMSNRAFSHSIQAYNENDSNLKSKNSHRKIAEKMSFIIAAEIDAVKSGKAPFYKAPASRTPFISYKTRVESDRKENTNFHLKNESPNLDYLKENAERISVEVSKKKKLLKKSRVSITRFTFENDSDWKKSLNLNLLKEISKLMIAYLDWNRQLGFIMQPSTYFDSQIQSTIQYIINLQYDDISMIINLDNLLIKLANLGVDYLSPKRELSLLDNYHLMRDQQQKEALLLKYFDGKLDDDEIKLLTNFSNGGHKLLHLILSDVILNLEKQLDAEFNSYDSITRYRVLLRKVFDRNKVQINDDFEALMRDALINGFSAKKLVKTYVSGTNIENTFDFEIASKYIKKIASALKKFPEDSYTYSLDDLNDISNIFTECNKLMYDAEDILRPVWNIRMKAEDYLNKKLDLLFKTNNVSRSDETKYYYALRDLDKSLRFLFIFAKSTMLGNVHDSNNRGDHYAK